MDHAAAKRADPLQRLCEIVYGEVRQREGIAWARAARMKTKRRVF
ncbi:MAG TPA: hypothetical protein VHY83_05690 [Solirubrobacteraceae bacterium]|jgi:hypothetical protein|nr:hypothetical protein [Solirubrobacteraceae bacterium]